LEFNVPFQHKYGYIRDEISAQLVAVDVWVSARDRLRLSRPRVVRPASVSHSLLSRQRPQPVNQI